MSIGTDTSITVRHVPSDVRDLLAARAAARGQSLQELMLEELNRIARRPSPAELVERIRARKAATGVRIDADTILELRDSERR